MSSALYIHRRFIMKQLLAIVLAAFAFTAFAADEPAKSAPTTSEHGVKLAKKKDHSKDKKVDATKSPKTDKKAPAKKADSKAK